MTSFARAGDITAIVYGGYSYVKHLESTGMSRKESFKKFQASTLKSQQSRLSAGRSQWQNEHSATTRLLLAFKNTINQYFRKQMDAIISYRNGDISAEKLSKITIIYSVIAPAVYSYTGHAMTQGMKAIGEGVFGAFHDEDDEEYPGLTSILVQIGVNPFQAIPLIDDVTMYIGRRIAGKRAYGVFSTPLIDDIAIAAQKLAKEDRSLADYLDIFGTPVELKTGAPIKTYLRIYERLFGEIE